MKKFTFIREVVGTAETREVEVVATNLDVALIWMHEIYPSTLFRLKESSPVSN